MEEISKDKLAPGRWFWCIINNLQKFDGNPEYMITLFNKFHKVKDHRVLSTFESVLNTVETYYNENKKFPDMAWLRLNYKDIQYLRKTEDEFSMQIYDSFIKYIDQEVLRDKINKLLITEDYPKAEDFRDLAEEMSKFATNNVVMPQKTKEMLLNLYDNYSSSFNGIKTHIKAIDEVIGVLGYNSLSVFAAPTGHGKSTFAFSVAYYAALSGNCVDYLSFEVPESDAWFNFVSIESHGTSHPLPSSKMKGSDLTDEEKAYYREHMGSMLNKIGSSGGFLNVVDQTSTSGVNTYTDLCAKLESIAEERGRKADLIIVDNVDNFQTLRSKERDEISKINNYIINLDSFSKRYHNGDGVAILLLSQVNRGAMARLYKAANESGKGSTHIDVTCVQKYNALYEKATCVLLGFADEAARSSGIMRIHPVKLRNRAVPITPIQVKVDYSHSKVMGDFVAKSMCKSQEEHNQMVRKLSIEVSSMEEIDQILAED